MNNTIFIDTSLYFSLKSTLKNLRRAKEIKTFSHKWVGFLTWRFTIEEPSDIAKAGLLVLEYNWRIKE